ncbi:MAG: hypothetical protein CK427_10520 [Leptospira sp.]|nr:MAG: hypothetical protein CK427_10520 [Leptospira sp.]
MSNNELGILTTQLQAGDSHSCGLLSKKAVLFWGAGVSGSSGYNIILGIDDGIGIGQAILQARDLFLE